MVSVHVFSKWTLKPTHWQPLDSKMLAAVAYEPEPRTLYLRFRSGEAYAYFEVPEDQYQKFLQGRISRPLLPEPYPRPIPLQRITHSRDT